MIPDAHISAVGTLGAEEAELIGLAGGDYRLAIKDRLVGKEGGCCVRESGSKIE